MQLWGICHKTFNFHESKHDMCDKIQDPFTSTENATFGFYVY